MLLHSCSFSCVFIYICLCFNSHFAADEGDLKMSVVYNGSTVAAMDMDSKIGYKQFFSEGSKFQYSGKSLNSFQIKHTTIKTMVYKYGVIGLQKG